MCAKRKAFKNVGMYAQALAFGWEIMRDCKQEEVFLYIHVAKGDCNTHVYPK